MKAINFYIICIFIISNILLQNTILRKYQKFYSVNNNYVIFDSSDFKVDDEIYIIITGKFEESVDEIEFQFGDDVEVFTDMTSNKRVSYNKKETKGNGREARYYTIKKSSYNLNGVEGKYLVIVPFTVDGEPFDIENTKENKGNSNTTIIVIVVVVIGVVIIGFIIFYCIKKKRQAAMQSNQNYPNSTNAVNVQNNTPQGYNNAQGYNNVQEYNNAQGYNNVQDYNNVQVYSNDAPYSSGNPIGNY